MAFALKTNRNPNWAEDIRPEKTINSGKCHSPRKKQSKRANAIRPYKNMKPTHYLKNFYFKDYLIITFGLALYAFGLIGFIKPAGIVTGGSAGIGLLLEFAFEIPLQWTYFGINAVLLAIAVKFLGFKFLIKTIYGVLMLTFLLSLARELITEPIVGSEPLMSSIIGAMMCGAGIGFVFSAGGSMGGTCIVVTLINRYKNMSFGRGTMFLDFVIISSSFFVFKSYTPIVLGLIVMGVMTYTIDLVINGIRQSVQFMIYSDKYDVIADAINIELNRGCTVLEGTGWYTKKPTKVIILVARRTEATQIFHLIKTIDPNAFISQSVVRGVWGQGFDTIK